MPGASVSPAPDGDGSEQTRRGLSRRAFLARGGVGALGVAALAGSGFGGYEIGTPSSPATPSGAAAAPTPRPRYKTASFDPPHLQIAYLGAPKDEGHVMITPSLLPTVRGVSSSEAIAEGKGQMGVMISDVHGELVWFQPTNELATNLQVQQYEGKPVLTYWVGEIDGGIGYGKGYLLDSAYEPVAVIEAGNGLKVDLHELTLTPQGTALVTAYRLTKTDLSAVGGPKSGAVQDSVVQEIDVKTGKVLFEWSSLAHVPVTESYSPWAKGVAYDYFHINSISLWDDNSLLISARNTWTLYKVDRHSGEVIWRMHGKKSDFSMAKGTNYEWQHHARHLGGGVLTVFDDGAEPTEEPASRGLVLSVDEARRRVSLTRAYLHPARLLAQFEGSVQLFPNGNAVVGYGGEPYATEFDKDGNVLFDLRFPTEVQSYRAFRYPWVGTPKTKPALTSESDGTGGYAVYVSWHGATEVRRWRVLSGSSEGSMTPVAEVAKAGFETAITVHPKGKHVAVEALDDKGQSLAVSKTITI